MFVITVGHILTLVFKGLVKWGKNSVGWHFGFKLHLIGIDLEEPDFPLSGRELPNYIYDRTKRKISLRTVYRWAEKHSIPFSVSRIIPPQELIKWLELGNAASIR
nr:transposase [Nostoc commune]